MVVAPFAVGIMTETNGFVVLAKLPYSSNYACSPDNTSVKSSKNLVSLLSISIFV